MTSAEVLAQVVPSVVAGATLAGLHVLLKSRDAQGARVGRVEKWIDREEGRREGYEQARRELREGRGGG